MRFRPPAVQSGMTLSEVLVIAVVVAVLYGLLLPAMSRPSCRGGTTDGNQLKQVMTAMIAYQATEECLPLGLPAASFACANAADAKEITIRSFEVLADAMQLPNGIWRSTNKRGRAPSIKPNRNNASSATGPGRWADAAAGVAIDWAYDWALPAECAAGRVVLATRNAALYRDKSVFAVCVDGGVRRCKPAADAVSAGADVTFGSTESDARCVNDEATGDDVTGSTSTAPDNIYNGLSDGLSDAGAVMDISVHAQTPHTGSARRCFLK